MMNYLHPHVGDEILQQQKSSSPLEKLTQKYQLNARQCIALIEIVHNGSLNIQQYEAFCSQVSRRTLQRDLQKMIKQGLLINKGKSNQLVYYLSPEVKI